MQKDSPERSWFRRRYYFWQPIAWQGYLTDFVFLAVCLGNFVIVAANPYSNELLWLYLNVLATAITTLLLIGRAKGPRE